MGFIVGTYQKFRVVIVVFVLLILIANLILTSIATRSPLSRELSIASATLNGVGILLISVLIGAYIYKVNAEISIDTSQFVRDEFKEE